MSLLRSNDSLRHESHRTNLVHAKQDLPMDGHFRIIRSRLSHFDTARKEVVTFLRKVGRVRRFYMLDGALQVRAVACLDVAGVETVPRRMHVGGTGVTSRLHSKSVKT